MAVHTGAGSSESTRAARDRAHRLIPGGAHTYSKDDAHFPPEAPAFIVSGRGSTVTDSDGHDWLDWGMGLRSVILGHAYPPVIEAAQRHLRLGSNFTRPSILEGDLAERLVELIPCAEMAKFGKNGSDATTAAIRLARAYTGRERILVCDGSFHASDDWWLSTQPLSAGTYEQGTRVFPYGDVEVLEQGLLLGDVAAVIMEPMAFVPPPAGYLGRVLDLAHKYGALLIFDEIITGFRFHLRGAQYCYGVTPDLATFGKAIANGFSVSALVGRREIMSTPGVHLLSATHGGETHALAAALATIDEIERHNVPTYLRKIGSVLSIGLRELGYTVEGYGCSPNVTFPSDKRWPPRDFSHGPSWRPLSPDPRQTGVERMQFVGRMAERGILMPYIAPSYSHTVEDVELTIEAAKASKIP